MSEQLWMPDPPRDAHDGHAVIVCSCDGGAYIGARKAGTVDRCGVCGFVTPAQMDALRVAILRDLARKCHNGSVDLYQEFYDDGMSPLLDRLADALDRPARDETGGA